jgi:hypothetical protein
MRRGLRNVAAARGLKSAEGRRIHSSTLSHGRIGMRQPRVGFSRYVAWKEVDDRYRDTGREGPS